MTKPEQDPHPSEHGPGSIGGCKVKIKDSTQQHTFYLTFSGNDLGLDEASGATIVSVLENDEPISEVTIQVRDGRYVGINSSGVYPFPEEQVWRYDSILSIKLYATTADGRKQYLSAAKVQDSWRLTYDSDVANAAIIEFIE